MKLKIGTKILAGFMVVLVLTIVVGLFGSRQMDKMSEHYGQIIKVNMPTLSGVWELRYVQQTIRGNIRAYMLYGEDRYEKSFLEADEKYKKVNQRLNELVQNDASKKYLADLLEQHNSYVRECKVIIQRLKAGDRLGAMAQAQVALPYARAYDAKAEEFIQFVDKTIQGWVNDAKNAEEQTDMITNIVLVIAVIFSLALAVFLSRVISKPIVSLTSAAGEVARGDLRVKVPDINTGDEVQQLNESFKTMVDGLKALIGNMVSSSHNVASTSQQLTASSQSTAAAIQQVAGAMEGLTAGAGKQKDNIEETGEIINQLIEAIEQIASGAQEQAMNVTQTAELVGQMAGGIQEVAASSQRVAVSSQQTTEVAKKGGQAVEKSIKGMERIKETVFDTANKIKDLGEHSKQIGEIIEVINDIAEQTNLLALNAAIEAARAGEHGKGFAVVADEVRKLAERSGKATKEIANLIINIQKGTDNAVTAMTVGTKEVEEGVVLAKDAGVALQEILTTVAQAVEQVETISAAAEQISASSSGVVKAIDNVAAITEQNTAATEEMAAGSNQARLSIRNVVVISQDNVSTAQEVSASTEEINASSEEIASSAQTLSQVAEELQEMVNRFKI
ncbi:MAG: HAMP domain-containing methyl-accepting chemotaxis protein [Clostridia bacterium]|nr:HAMP domain-containing methyl-accepting chemotaxis protein [Clostridia bacterium]